MLITEEALLWLHGRFHPDRDPTQRIRAVLAATVLTELSDMDRLGVTRETQDVAAGRLLLLDNTSTGQPVLDAALPVIERAEGEFPAGVALALLGTLDDAVRDSLVAQGMLERTADGGLEHTGQGRRWVENARARLAAEVEREGSGAHETRVLADALVGAGLERTVWGEDVVHRAEEKPVIDRAGWAHELAVLAANTHPSGGSGAGAPAM